MYPNIGPSDLGIFIDDSISYHLLPVNNYLDIEMGQRKT